MLQGAVENQERMGSDHPGGTGQCVTCGGALGTMGPGGYATARGDDSVIARVCSQACYHGYWAVVMRRYQASVGV